MRPKGGTFFFLLIGACLTLAKRPNGGGGGGGGGGGKQGKKEGLKGVSRKMMAKCKQKDYTMPERTELEEIFNTSDLPMVDPNSKQMDIFLSRFLEPMQSSQPRRKGEKPDKMADMWNCSNLPAMIRMIRDSSEDTACYMRAFVVLSGLKALKQHSECNMTSEDYDTLLWVVKPLLKNKAFKFMDLPFDFDAEIIKKIMRATPNQKWKEVLDWGKECITQKYFSCTTRPPPDPRTEGMKSCEPSVPWLNSEALYVIGARIFNLKPYVWDYASKDELCEFLFSGGFKNATIQRRETQNKPVPPSVIDMLWNKVQDCFKGENELAENMDKFGMLACKHVDGQNLTSNISYELLSDPSICKPLKKSIIRNLISKRQTDDLYKWGHSVELLSPRQIKRISAKQLKEAVEKRDFQLGLRQQFAVAKQLCPNKCKKLSWRQLLELRSIVRALPMEDLKNIKEVLNDTEGLKNLSRYMRKGQRTAMLKHLSTLMNSSQLVRDTPDPLRCTIPLNEMVNLSFTSEVQEKTWCPPQAAYIAKMLFDGKKKSFRAKKLRSLLRGVSCEWIKNVSDSEAKEMAWEITGAPEWLSQKLAGCAAQRLFMALEKERPNYFSTVTGEELDEIPTLLLFFLRPQQVMDLPANSCSVLLDKLEDAELSLAPRRSRSLSALTERALLCLANGENLSMLTYDQVLSLGPFICELQSSQLRLLARDVRNSTLLEMASCENIPERNRAEIVELVKENWGNPANWSQETMETIGSLILWDDKTISALPYKSWLKEVLMFFQANMKRVPRALRKKLYELTTISRDNRYTRAADSKNLTIANMYGLEMGDAYLGSDELDHMSDDTLRDIIDILGTIPDLSKDQLAVLSQKVKIISESGDSNVNQLGCILRGYDSKELEELLLSPDDLEIIANCNWNESQVKALWRAVAKTKNLTAKMLEAKTMVSLTRFICGLSSSEIQQLSEEAFKYAVGSIDVCQCSFEVLEQFKIRAVSAFGSPETWSEAQVSELGCIVAGLDKNELGPLDPSVFSFIDYSSIPLIPPKNLAALSIEQIEALSPESGDSVTDEQKEALGDEQKAALERASTGTINLAQRSTLSGAPSLSVEGIAAFMKPLLFLLMGFLLL